MPGADRLQKYVGKRKVSFYYLYPNGSSETVASAPIGDRKAIAEAERVARRKVGDIQQGQVVAGSIAEMIDRFALQTAPIHYEDQSKDGIAVRKGAYANLTKFFGRMSPMSLRQQHGYQYIEARRLSGAPAKGKKELSLMTTICHYGVEWGLLAVNPFVGMKSRKHDKDVRTTQRGQIVKFYLWTNRQDNPQYATLGCAAYFTYLTGYRAAEVRPFHISGITKEGVVVLNAKRKKGEDEVTKLRDWSPRLRTVVARARQTHGRERMYLFANRHGKAYSRSGWGSVWQDVMLAWIGSFDPTVTAKTLVQHPMYFSLLDVRPAAITTKINNRSADMYDFAAHANPATTHRHYDRRKLKRATATE